MAKAYADATSVTYTRSPDGKLLTRTWARQVGPSEDEDLITEYVYDEDTGELTEVKYYHDTEQTPDPDTHGIEYTYTRLGQHHTVGDIVGTHTFAYNAYGELASETIEAGANGLYSRTITRDYENGTGETVAGRNAGFHIDTEYVVTYAYEPKTTGTGRLNRINGPGLPEGLPTYSGGAFYGYTANSDLVGSLTYKDASGTAVASATREYDDHRDLLENVENKAGSGLPVVSKYLYASDGAGRRTSVVYTGSAFGTGFHVDFGYNDRGELTAADRRQGTTPGQGNHLVADKHAFDYTYDPIGNRITYNVDDSGTPTHYCANEVNQYDATAAAAGCATPTESFNYDDDGNLTADGTMTYVWNGENRLVEAVPTTPATNDKKVEFKYDYLGRRVEKVVWTYSGSAWSVTSTQRFVYGGPALDTPGTGGSQGWNVVLVLDGSGTTQRKYTWGLDRSGRLVGAGGIGGLLAAVETHGTISTADDDAYWYFYDGNGNVGQIIDTTDHDPASDMRIVAHYEYDPYGNSIVVGNDRRYLDGSLETADAGYANDNPLRFSTKWFDVATGAYYYIFRYYAPRLGRWLNRDPIAVSGGLNIHEFASNNPVTRHDALGLRDSGGCEWPPSFYPLARAAKDDYAKWLWLPPEWMERLEDLTSDSFASLECSFEDASQRGCVLCNKRCRFKCTGHVQLTFPAVFGIRLRYYWSFYDRTICTEKGVLCVPSWEAHACEDGQMLDLDALGPMPGEEPKPEPY